MPIRQRARQGAARADYLRGDPAEPGPVTGGRLALEPTCLRFTGPDGAELAIELEELEGVTVSGSRGGRRRAPRTPRGTMFVAGVHSMRPTVWEFAIDRSAGVAIRDRMNGLLARSGREPLPFVEALDDFPPLPVVIEGDPLEAGDIYEEEAYDEEPDEQELYEESQDEDLNVDALEPAPGNRKRRVRITIAVVLVVLLLEVLIPLLIIRGL